MPVLATRIGTLVVTGGTGFLGWHVRVVARALGLPEPVLIPRTGLDNPERLAGLLSGADRVLHLAGVSRGEVDTGNRELAGKLAAALRRCGTPPKTVVYANSVQAGNGTPYGDGKAAAADTIAEATRWSGSKFEDVGLPNLFGEHGRPHYNSVVATFCRMLADGGSPHVEQDRELDLLHAGDAARLLLGVPGGAEVRPVRRTVGALAAQLGLMARLYRSGEIPPLPDRFDVRLFNTYRSHCFPDRTPRFLTRHVDERGELVEAVRAHGGGQTFVSSTHPGVTRGEHFHLAKIERFMVLRGAAEIRLRRVLHSEILRFQVSGSRPSIVDMPTMWAHDITNVGDGELLTVFWSNEHFDPAHPDTYAERVSP
jgi:UDP-2-acetamido-2,6-beta-L-arabino-hexul-4-ose reductase